MTDTANRLTRRIEGSAKVSELMQKRIKVAQQKFIDRARKAYAENGALDAPRAQSPFDMWNGAAAYAVDFAQRSVLYWDTMRERGNNYVERVRAGLPPVLHFEYETVMDGREMSTPVNYALVRIIPPEGLKVDARKRPYVIIDPRAGHGPGIGGFKDDSEVGVRLARGPPGLLRHLLSGTRARPDAAGRVQCGEAVRPARARAASRFGQADHRRQLPGWLGRDDAGLLQPGRHRTGGDQRRSHVLLGRRL